MKFSLPLTIFAVAAAVDATAVAEPEAEAAAQYCRIKGQSCWKVKRDAEAEASAQYCRIKGQSCWKVKRAADAFAEVINANGGLSARNEANGADAYLARRQIDDLARLVAVTRSEPYEFYASLGPVEERDLTEKEKRDAEASAQYCRIKGQSCWKEKREAEPQYCRIKGQSCWKEKRDAEASAQYCRIKGQSCWKAKRAAEAIINAIDARDVEVEARDASADASCNAPGGDCNLAMRDLHAMYNAARSVIDAHSE
ncbi:hypothetical protein B0T17DRAFT_507793 [Bombardia bombarda]|uniref:Clock-controlled pheromone ccg-4 n=1 Tax=Bombardia bombarda TaxID=252184 RepID=A0AA39X0I2_9PEZI|nr:hypothetical protein B0T17DRAFT_507793 [Bombardia bombarda]